MRDDLQLGNGNVRLPWKKLRSFEVEGDIGVALPVNEINTSADIVYDEKMKNVVHIKSDDLKRRKFKDGVGYRDACGQVWIYYDCPPYNSITIPWFSKCDDGIIYLSYVPEEILSDFHEDKIRDISLERIEKDTKENEELYNEEELKFLNAATSVYKPEIKEEDDFLKKVVKKLLLKLEININRFAPKFQEKYELTNMRTALQNKTKTSTKVFSKWMELLNSNFTLIVKTKDDADPKMKGYIIYNSKDNSIKYVDELHRDDIL